MVVNILYHRNCFDGLSSAALFTSFYKQHVDATATFHYIGKQHGNTPVFSEDDFTGDVNVCVDFRYSPHPKLDWWFDHHQSAFITPEDKEHFERSPSPQKCYDPTRTSNGKFMADRLHQQFGFILKPYEELLKWVDIIDGAQFPNAHMPVELKEPALQLMTWIEHSNNRRNILRLIKDLQKESFETIVQKRYIRKSFDKIFQEHQKHLEIFQKKIEIKGNVAYFDLTEESIRIYNKFIVYHFYENILYTVGVNKFPARCKIAVGSNPWDRERRTHNIAQICEKYGGGGHPVVGAISVDAQEVERARAIAAEVVEILNH